jgi:hypothetical protein
MSVGRPSGDSLTWDAIGAIGDFVGGIAVVASLIYLAIQVRHGARVTAQNAKEQRAAARESLLDAIFRWSALVSDGELSRIYLKGCEDLPSLSGDERFRFGLLIQQFILAHNRLFERATEGTSPLPAVLAVQAVCRLLERPGARQWWERNAEQFSPEFRSAVSAEPARSNHKALAAPRSPDY